MSSRSLPTVKSPGPAPSPIVVVTDANLSSWRDDLEAALPSGTVVAWPDPTDDTAIQEALLDGDVLVGPRYTSDMGGAGKKLQLVQVAGAGTDKIDVNALPRGTQVANTFHHEDSIAEYVVAATVLLRRGILRQDAALRRGEWASPAHNRAEPWVSGLAGATVGFRRVRSHRRPHLGAVQGVPGSWAERDPTR